MGSTKPNTYSLIECLHAEMHASKIPAELEYTTMHAIDYRPEQITYLTMNKTRQLYKGEKRTTQSLINKQAYVKVSIVEVLLQL